MKYWMKPNLSRLFVAMVMTLTMATSFTTPTENPMVQLVEINTPYGRIVVALYNETPLHRDNFIQMVNENRLDSLLFHRVVPEVIIQGGDPRSKYAKSEQLLGTTDSGKGIPMELSKTIYHKRGALAMARDRRNPYQSSPHQFFIVQGRTFTSQELLDIENNNNIVGKQEVLNRILQSDTVQARFEDFKLRGDKEGLHEYMVSLQDGLDKVYEPLAFAFSTEQAQQYMTIGGAPHLDGLYTVFGEVVYGMNVVDSIASVSLDEHERPLKDIRITAKVIQQKATKQKR
jgi:cyclophilin family peptidyl-prolyl cis-trans isomerase